MSYPTACPKQHPVQSKTTAKRHLSGVSGVIFAPYDPAKHFYLHGFAGLQDPTLNKGFDTHLIALVDARKPNKDQITLPPIVYTHANITCSRVNSTTTEADGNTAAKATILDLVGLDGPDKTWIHVKSPCVFHAQTGSPCDMVAETWLRPAQLETDDGTNAFKPSSSPYWHLSRSAPNATPIVYYVDAQGNKIDKDWPALLQWGIQPPFDFSTDAARLERLFEDVRKLARVANENFDPLGIIENQIAYLVNHALVQEQLVKRTKEFAKVQNDFAAYKAKAEDFEKEVAPDLDHIDNIRYPKGNAPKRRRIAD